MSCLHSVDGSFDSLSPLQLPIASALYAVLAYSEFVGNALEEEGARLSMVDIQALVSSIGRRYPALLQDSYS